MSEGWAPSIPPAARRRVGGRRCGGGLRVETPPQELDVGVVDPLDPSGGAAADGEPAMRVAIDSATVDRGGVLQVEGWVVCRVQIERVETFIDGALVGEAEFGRVR